MNEKLIERKLQVAVKRKGGIAIKLAPFFFAGLPDRLVLIPVGKARFAEIKTTGKKTSPIQRRVFRLLERIGFPVAILDDQTSLDKFLLEL